GPLELRHGLSPVPRRSAGTSGEPLPEPQLWLTGRGDPATIARLVPRRGGCAMAKCWSKGRGKLGFLRPRLGTWVAEAGSPMGPVRCTREFEAVLGGAYVRLTALWQFGAAAKPPESRADLPRAGGGYQELALIGAGDGGAV